MQELVPGHLKQVLNPSLLDMFSFSSKTKLAYFENVFIPWCREGKNCSVLKSSIRVALMGILSY